MGMRTWWGQATDGRGRGPACFARNDADPVAQTGSARSLDYPDRGACETAAIRAAVDLTCKFAADAAWYRGEEARLRRKPRYY